MYMLVAFRPLISNDRMQISCSLISYSFNSGSSDFPGSLLFLWYNDKICQSSHMRLVSLLPHDICMYWGAIV